MAQSFWDLMVSFAFPQGFETGGKRKDEKTEGKVSDGVQDVKAQSHSDPRESLFKGKAVRDGLYRGVQCAEEETVETTEGGINRRSEPDRHFLRQKHRRAPKKRPQIEVGNPPDRKSCEESV